jgi:hypothetical protein
MPAEGSGNNHPVLEEIGAEVDHARDHYGPIHSAHESIAVLREEYLEAEREVFAKRLDADRYRRELIQLAAMCVRTIEDLGLQASPLARIARQMEQA